MTTTADLPAPLRALFARVADGDTPGTLRIVTGLGPEERKLAAAELPRYAAAQSAAHRGWWEWREQFTPLIVAGAACVGGAAAVTSWLFRREFRWRVTGDGDARIILALLRERPEPWRADAARRIAGRLRTPDLEHWEVAAELVRETGIEPPADEAFMAGWLRWGLIDERAAADPLFPHLAPRVFDCDSLADEFGDRQADTVARLVASGALDRAAVIEGAVTRLLRDGPAAPVPLVWLLDALAPTLDEAEGLARDLVRMLPTVPVAVADMALARLRELEAAGRLEDDLLAEAVEALAFRPEKKLVRAAVAWIDDAVRREPRRADLGLRALAAIFAIDTLMIQERAVRVAARLAARAGDEGRTAIMEAAGGLPAELREKIATAYGETVAARDTGPAPVLVAPPGPALPPPVASPEELVRRLSAVADPLPVAEFECLLAGLAEWAHREPGTLRELLLSWWQPLNPGFFGYVGYATYETLLTLFRRVVLAFASPPDSRSLSATIKTEQVYWHGRNVLDEFYRDRAHELIAHFEDERAYPALLAAPTSATGSIDPAVLLDRIERLDAAGVEALPADLAQALLRLDPEAGEPVAERAEKTSGEAGRALAAWVRGGGLPDRRARCEVRHHKRYYSDYQEIEIAFDPPVEGPFRKLFTPTSSYADTMEFWPLVLPAHREVVAAHALAALQLHVSGSGTDQAAVLVSLAHADGPIGRAMACALACAMGFEAASGRAAAADALLVLAARGQVPAAELARAVTDLVTGEFVKLSRVIGVLDDVTGAGGHEAVWAIVAELLPALLPGPGERPRNGLADLLAAGARAAAPAAAKAVIPELAAVAARKGSSRLAQEARRLQALLTG